MGIIILLVIDLFFAFTTGLIAKYKGRNYILWGIIGLLTTFIGLIVVMFVGKVNINDNENQQNITSDSENDIFAASESQAKENDVNDGKRKKRKSFITFKFIWIMTGVISFIIAGIFYKVYIEPGKVMSESLKGIYDFFVGVVQFTVFVPVAWVLIRYGIPAALGAYDSKNPSTSSKKNVVEKIGKPIWIEHYGENGLLICDSDGPLYSWHINHLIADTVVLDPIEYNGMSVTLEDIRNGRYIIYLARKRIEIKRGSRIENYSSGIFGMTGCPVNRFKCRNTIVI